METGSAGEGASAAVCVLGRNSSVEGSLRMQEDKQPLWPWCRPVEGRRKLQETDWQVQIQLRRQRDPWKVCGQEMVSSSPFRKADIRTQTD